MEHHHLNLSDKILYLKINSNILSSVTESKDPRD